MAPPARPTRPTWSRPSPPAPSPVAAALAEARLQHGDRSRAIRDAVADVLAEGAVEVGFQPVVELATGDVVGYEALARGPRGTPLERPDRLFAAARAAGRLDELDWLCQRLALRAALDAGLRSGQVLFLNVEPDASGFMPLELRALYAQATTRMTVAVEVTERALTERPAALLGHVADMRALGCAVALDDVGAAAGSLAMLPVLAPDVVKLDLHLLLEVDEQVFGDVVGTVAAQAERTGALVLVERIEQEGQVAMARALGAELAQGWLYGRRLLLEQAPEPPEADRVVPATVRPDPRDLAPFGLLGGGAAPRRGGAALVGSLAGHLTANAASAGEHALMLGAFGAGPGFDRSTAARWSELAGRLAFCGAVAPSMPSEPAPGVRGGTVVHGDPVGGEWSLAVVGPHVAAALSAHDLGPGVRSDERFAFHLTHDRDAVVAAAGALMARIRT